MGKWDWEALGKKASARADVAAANAAAAGRDIRAARMFVWEDFAGTNAAKVAGLIELGKFDKVGYLAVNGKKLQAAAARAEDALILAASERSLNKGTLTEKAASPAKAAKAGRKVKF